MLGELGIISKMSSLILFLEFYLVHLSSSVGSSPSCSSLNCSFHFSNSSFIFACCSTNACFSASADLSFSSVSVSSWAVAAVRRRVCSCSLSVTHCWRVSRSSYKEHVKQLGKVCLEDGGLKNAVFLLNRTRITFVCLSADKNGCTSISLVLASTWFTHTFSCPLNACVVWLRRCTCYFCFICQSVLLLSLLNSWSSWTHIIFTTFLPVCSLLLVSQISPSLCWCD